MTIRPDGGTPPPPAARPCPWPRCETSIQASEPAWRLMCPPHWGRLPATLRAPVLAAYQPGQTVLTASPAYRLAVADAVMHAHRVGMFDPAPAAATDQPPLFDLPPAAPEHEGGQL